METEILALREEPTSEVLLERFLKRARGSSSAGAGEGEHGGIPSLSEPTDTAREAVEALVFRFMRDRHRVSN